MAAIDGDILSELLVAQLLEEDLRNLAFAQEAEQVQLEEALAVSSLAAGCNPKLKQKAVTEEALRDVDIAFQTLAAEVRLSSDAAYAQSLQHLDDSNAAASRHQALRLAAAERKYMLDAEYARRLQEEDERVDIDADQFRDMESVLNRDVIERLLASDLNNKGKATGKSRQPPVIAANNDSIYKGSEVRASPYLTCGICMESFQATYSPLAASRSANSSLRLPYGMRLPCPGNHGYCLGCLSAYIRNKLDPDGDSTFNPDMVVFPVRCPECSVAEWPSGISDDVAERILEEKGMVLWYHQKLLSSLPKFYCPNKRCSTLVQVHDDPDEPQALCPSCNELLCVPCQVVWHEDMTCEEFQALPLDERSPEDQQALQLMRTKSWRRCPNCSFIVELTVGCNHITCRCKTEFCFRCGSLWDIQRKSCTRDPPCELWDENMLLEERERQRELEHERVQAPVADLRDPQAAPRLEAVLAPHVALRHLPYDEYPPWALQAGNAAPARDLLEWMDDPDILCSKHLFTSQMIQNLECGYCNARLTSTDDLQYHLSHVRRHPVYACCGRFFKSELDLERHQNAYPGRFGTHIHSVRRD
ncbi:hypothetical protein WOLCODRAFT_78291 [Wolfiporia cocos MD-104 SS10]|uniref:RBR-type E3 ubiquitin transferase n=1 Tax=Wolfiporia cocos (strain MD-104) TaxID=742152 RepID=A0A2H3JTH3_WOLCO|nr:hypothetical protein WOLCODRAFT_78291 [Wolfiporia cocos MD-104 SS10]